MNEVLKQANIFLSSYTAKGAKKYRQAQKRRVDAFLKFALAGGLSSLENLSYRQFKAFLEKNRFEMKYELEYCYAVEHLLLALPQLSEKNRRLYLKIEARKKFFLAKLKEDRLTASLQTEKKSGQSSEV